MEEPCTGCPDAANYKEVVKRGRLDFAALNLPQVYFEPIRSTGHPLQGLQYTLPPSDGIQRQFQRAVFHPDGSIEYPKLQGDSQPPDEIDGYRRDADNPWRFIPVWPDCALRMHGTRLKTNGCIEVTMACNNPQAVQFSKPVKCADCEACPVRRP